MKKSTKEFILWVALFLALLLIPALIWYLTARGMDDYIADYAEQYRERYGIVSQADEPENAADTPDDEPSGIIDAVSPGDIYYD